jgi:NADP-dependent 3-hydroxy acid dehydrogenase YdfG
VSYPLPREVDLSNTNIIITGGTSGVGLEAAKVGRGPSGLLLGRTLNGRLARWAGDGWQV